MQRRSLILIIGAAAVLMSVINIVIVLRSASAVLPIGGDSYSYFAAGQMLARGEEIGTGELVVLTPTPRSAPSYRYPPFLAMLFIPFAAIDFSIGLALWMSIVAITTLWLVWSLRSFTGLPIAAIGVLAFLPTWQSLYLGQVNATIAALTAMAFLACERQQWTRGGVWFAFGTLLKFAPGLALLVLAIRRSWQAVGVAAATTLALAIFTLPFASWRAWPASVLAMADAQPNPLFVSIAAYLSRVLGPQAQPLVLVVTVGIVAVTVWRSRHVPLLFALAAAIIAPLLVTIAVWQYTTVLVLPALAVLWQRNERGRLLAGITWLCTTLIGGITIPVMFTLCWTACCWPALLHIRQATHPPQARPATH